ncbi:MAG: hypothetical protein FVQ83_01475 [Chloroflexi bacterium]|nr:hypothetical protein [Chloroflexota bacterium]
MNSIIFHFFSAIAETSTSSSAATAAYLDPGSGSFIIQLIVASAAGVLYMLRGYFSRFFSFFRKSSSDKSPETDELDDIE